MPIGLYSEKIVKLSLIQDWKASQRLLRKKEKNDAGSIND